jgi:hypothetical protein
MENTSKFGIVSWDEVKVEKPVYNKTEKKQRKYSFAKLVKGKNEFRCVTSPIVYLVHEIKEPGKKGVTRIKCAHTNCELCNSGNEAKKRYYVGVISRATGNFEILDAGAQVMEGIVLCTEDEEFGSPIKYDINIIVNPDSPSNYYTVKGKIPKPMSAKDQEIMKSVDLEELKTMAAPLNSEGVSNLIKYFAKKNEGRPLDLNPAKTARDAKRAAKAKEKAEAPTLDEEPTPSSSDDEELDLDFPAVN